MKSSGVGGGVASALPKFLICWKSEQNPWKSGYKWRPTLFDLKNCTQGLQKNTWRPFFGGRTKKRLHDFVGRKFVGKNCTKNFSGEFVEIWSKILRTLKTFPAPTRCTYDEKAPPPPLSPFCKGRGEMFPPCVPVHIILRSPYSL